MDANTDHPNSRTICRWVLRWDQINLIVLLSFLAWAYLSTVPRCQHHEWRYSSWKIWTHNDTIRTDNEGGISSQDSMGMWIWWCRNSESKPEFLTHPIVEQSPYITPVLYTGVKPKPCVSTIKPREWDNTICWRHEFLPVHLQIFQVPKRLSVPQTVICSFTWGTRVWKRKIACRWKVWLNVRSCLRRICIILSSLKDATTNICFVYVGHVFLNRTFPVNVSILEMMKGRGF
jgi:hypothetical protein